MSHRFTPLYWSLLLTVVGSLSAEIGLARCRAADPQSPLDKLDPAKIPAEQRTAWQPKELVAILGEQRGRHWGKVTCVALSSDGKLIVSGGEDHYVRLWDAATLRELAALGGHKEVVTGLALSADGKTLASSDRDGQISLWDLGEAQPRERVRFRGGSGLCDRLLLTADGKTLACAGDFTRSVQLWNIGGARPVAGASLEHGGAIQTLAFTRDGKTLAAGSDYNDHTVYLWDLAGDKPTQRAALAVPKSVATLAFTPDDKTLIAGLYDKESLRLWDLHGDKPKERPAPPGHKNVVFGLGFTADGKMLATVSNDETVRLWDVAGDKLSERAVLKWDYAEKVAPVVFSPDGKTLTAVRGSYVNNVNLTRRSWDLSGDKPKEQLVGPPDTYSLNSLSCTTDGKTLAAGGGEDMSGPVQLWEFGGDQAHELPALKVDKGRKALAWAPDGKHLAVAGRFVRNMLHLYAREGEKVEEIPLPKSDSGWLMGVAFSADGKLLATANFEHKVELWDVTGDTLKKRADLPTSARGGPGSVAFSPDGKVLAWGGATFNDDGLQLWDVSGDKPRRLAVDGGQGHVVTVAFSPDGKWLAAGGAFGDKTARLFDVSGRELKLLHTLRAHTSDVYSVAFTPDGKTLATAGQDGRLIFWEAATGRKQREWHLPGEVNAVVFLPDGRHLATANGNGTVYILRVKPGETDPSLQPPKSAVKLVPPKRDDLSHLPAEQRTALLPKETVAVLGDQRGRHWAAVTCLAYSLDGKVLASGGRDRLVRLWDAPTLRELAVLEGHQATIGAVAFSPDGKTLATADRPFVIEDGFEEDPVPAEKKGVVILWDLSGESAREVARWPAHVDGTRALAFTPDGKTLATGGGDKTVALWDVSGGQAVERSRLKGYKGQVRALAFAPGGQLLVSSGDDGARLWDLSGPEPKARAPLSGYDAAAFAPDGKTLAVASLGDSGGGGRHDHVDLWNLDGPQPAKGFPLFGHGRAAIHTLAFRADGQQVVEGGDDGTLIIWDISSKEPVKWATIGKLSAVFAVAFSPDGNFVAAGTQNGLVRLWNVAGNQPEFAAPKGGAVGAMRTVSFSADGKRLATLQGEAGVKLWQWEENQVKQLAELEPDSAWLNTLALSPDGKALTAAGGVGSTNLRGQVTLWNVSGATPGKPVTVQLVGGAVSSLAFAPDGKTLAVGGNNVSLCAVDGEHLTVGGEFVSHTDNVSTVAFSGDGKILAVAGFGGIELLRLGDKPTSLATIKVERGQLRGLAFADRGKTLAAGYSDGSVRRWDVSGKEPTELAPLKGHTAAVEAVVAIGAGEQIVSAGKDGRILVWDAAGKQVQEWHLPGPVASLAATPDGRYLATANANGTVYLLQLRK